MRQQDHTGRGSAGCRRFSGHSRTRHLLQPLDLTKNQRTPLPGPVPPAQTGNHTEEQPVTTLPLGFADDPKWKIDDRIFSRFLLKDAPRPPRADRSDASIKRKPDSSTNKGREDAEQHPECVFLTQVNDIPQSEDNPSERKSTHATCVTLRDCAVLMDAKPIPNLGIQAAVRMLEARLRNRNVYKDSKPKVDVPKPHRRREKSVLSDAKALPPIKPPKQRAEDMMKEIRESTSRREVPLSEMGVSRQEALLLLRDMKTKYKRLYEKTMEEAAGSDGNGAERLGGFSRLFVLEQHLDVESSV